MFYYVFSVMMLSQSLPFYLKCRVNEGISSGFLCSLSHVYFSIPSTMLLKIQQNLCYQRSCVWLASQLGMFSLGLQELCMISFSTWTIFLRSAGAASFVPSFSLKSSFIIIIQCFADCHGQPCFSMSCSHQQQLSVLLLELFHIMTTGCQKFSLCYQFLNF